MQIQSPKSCLSALILVLLFAGCASHSDLTKNEPPTPHERALLLMNVAASSLSDGDATGAIISLQEANTLDPKIAELHYLFALAYFQKNETTLATQSARKALQLKPDFSKAKNTLGKLLLDQGKDIEAEKYLLDATQDLTFREAYLAKTNLGILYYKKMNYHQATYWLTSALTENPTLACIAAFYRGKIYLEQNLFEKAQADFSISSKNACASLSESHLALGQTFIRLKKYDQARAKMLEIKQLFPTTDSAISAERYLKEIP